MQWFIRILTVALPLIAQYGPTALQLAKDLLAILQGGPAAEAATRAPVSDRERRLSEERDQLASAIEGNLKATGK
jgi:hypothetical protein